MLIDIIFAVLMLIAIIKGISRGFIIGVFSFFAFFIGLAAALKLSALVAEHLKENINVSGRWLPIISFIIVFILVVFIVRIGAMWLDKTIKFVWLGWLNRLLGIILYVMLYITIFSVFLFFAIQLNLIKQETISKSETYHFIQPWAPYVMEKLGTIIPWFKDMFQELENFFQKLATT